MSEKTVGLSRGLDVVLMGSASWDLDMEIRVDAFGDIHRPGGDDHGIDDEKGCGGVSLYEKSGNCVKVA